MLSGVRLIILESQAAKIDKWMGSLEVVTSPWCRVWKLQELKSTQLTARLTEAHLWLTLRIV